MVTLPCAGAVLAVTVSPVPVSFVSTLGPTSAVLTGVVTLSFVATGPTVIETVAVVERPEESVAVYVKESTPE